MAHGLTTPISTTSSGPIETALVKNADGSAISSPPYVACTANGTLPNGQKSWICAVQTPDSTTDVTWPAGAQAFRVQGTTDAANAAVSLNAAKVAGSGTAPVAKALRVTLDGDSIGTEDYATWHDLLQTALTNALQAKTSQQLAAVGLTAAAPVFNYVAISGQTAAQMDSAAADVDGSYDSAKFNLLLSVGEPYNPYRGPANANVPASQGVNDFLAYCQHRKAAGYQKIAALVGFGDHYRGSNTDFNPPRAGFDALMAQVVSSLKNNLNANGLDVVAVVDPVFDQTDPSQSADGVHPTRAAYQASIVARLVAGAMQALFGDAQPAAVPKPTTPPANSRNETPTFNNSANYPDGYTALVLATGTGAGDVQQLSQGIYAAAVKGNYGNYTALSIAINQYLKGGTSGRIVFKYAADDAADAIGGLRSQNAATTFQNQDYALYRPSDTPTQLNRIAAGSPSPQGAIAKGDFYGIYVDGTTGTFYPQKVTPGGAWTDLGAAFSATSTTDEFATFQIEVSAGKLYYPCLKGGTNF